MRTHKISISTTFSLACLLLISGLGLAASENPSESCVIDPGTEMSSTLFALADFAAEARPHIHREEFDLNERLDKLDYDAEQILRFVSEETAFEPYSGLLRGATGTLMSRAGNSIDQALLLATLLRDAGFEARISHGELSLEEAQRLVTMLARTPRAADPWDEEAMHEAQKRFFASVPSPSASQSKPDTREATDLMDKAEAERALIVRQMSDAGVHLGAPEWLSQITEEARTYYWVEYRLGPSEPWRSTHPAFGSARAPEVRALETFDGTIPEELTHRVRLEILVDQKIGDRLETHPLFDPIEAPSANLVGRSLRLALVPDQYLSPDDEDPVNLKKTRFLIPFFNGALPDGARVLSIDGTLIPPDALSLGAADFFQEVSAKTNKAASALQDLDSPSGPSDASLVGLSSVRLVVTLRKPDGSEKRSERIWFDASELESPGGSETSLAEEIATALGRTDEIFVAAGNHPPGFVLDSMLAWLEDSRPKFESLKAASLEDCDSLECLPDLTEDADSSRLNLATVYASLEGIWTHRPELRSFRDEPGVVILTEALAPSPSYPIAVIDIVSNSRRVLRLNGDRVSQAPEEAVLGGVWESLIEEQLLSGFWGEDRSAARTIRQQMDEGLPLTVLNGDPRSAGPSALTDGPVQRLIEQDLEAGYLVLIPERDSEATRRPVAWWRIRAGTGEVLAMARYGGQAAREYSSVWNAWNKSLVKLLRGRPIEHCVQSGSGGTQVVSCAWCSQLPIVAGVGWVRATAGIGAVTATSEPFSVFRSVETPFNRCTLQVTGSGQISDGGGGPSDPGPGGEMGPPDGPGPDGQGGGGGDNPDEPGPDIANDPPGGDGNDGNGSPGVGGGGDGDAYELCCKNEQGELVDCSELEEGEGRLVECR